MSVLVQQSNTSRTQQSQSHQTACGVMHLLNSVVAVAV